MRGKSSKSYSERYDALVHDGEVVLSGIEPGTFGYDELRKMLARLRDYKYAYMLFIRDYNAHYKQSCGARPTSLQDTSENLRLFQNMEGNI